MKDSQSLKKKTKKQKKKAEKRVQIQKSTVIVQTVRKFEFDLKLLLIPLILLVIFATLSLLNNYFFARIAENKIYSSPSAVLVRSYPIVDTVETPVISAKAAIALDADSQVILFSKNPQLRFSMASTTKIMTALIGLDYYHPNSVLTIKADGVQGTTLGFIDRDRFFFEDLLYAMLLPSANDAAMTIAENYPGGITAFVNRMNEKARTFFLLNTNYADPAGLDDDGDYTTVVDLSRLASLAMKNQNFAKVTATKEKMISDLGHGRQYQLFNLNKLLGQYGVNGVKTGTTEGAGEVLVTSAVENGHHYIIVVMNSEDRFADTQTLLLFISQHVQYTTPHP